MNDTTQTPTAAVEDRHATKLETISLLTKFLAVFNEHINQQVERKVSEIFQSHATMSLIDERTKEMLNDLVKEKMDEHEGDYEHHSTDDIVDTVATHIAHMDFSSQIKSSVIDILNDNDYPNEDRVADMITDYVEGDMDCEEVVKKGLKGLL